LTPWDSDLTKPLALLIGGEATGLPAEILAASDEVLRIPTRGFIPSYNVQAATGILLGEYLRQTALRQTA
jgi:tRNA G18 (ribose-2'-O)-methylase SpoU